MRNRVRTLLLLLAVFAIAAACVAATAVKDKEPAKLSIAINDKGITFGPKSPIGNQDFIVLFKNFASKPIGLKLSGKDKAGSDFVRYTNVIPRGTTESFRFYFRSKSTVNIRSVLSVEKSGVSIVKAKYGTARAKIKFK